MSLHDLSIEELSDEAICARVSAAFGVELCRWQIQVVRSLCKQTQTQQRRDHCLISATGSGKTVTFLAPLLFVPQGGIIVITPLNLLSDQVASQLCRIGIPAIALSAENAHQRTFQSIHLWKYRVIVTNIEIALKPRGYFEKLWRDKKWTSRLICVVWDEAHCVSKWADFRVEYKNAGRIRQLLHEPVPYYLTSATLPKPVLYDVYRNLGISPSNVNLIHRSNDRPNIHLAVRGFKHRMDTYRDLDFIVSPTGRPPPFIIFFNSIRESVDAVKHLRSLLPFEDRFRIKWFNSHMTSQYRQDELKFFEEGSTWGLACTDSFGLGVDSVRRIEWVIQYGAHDVDACTLAQRLGRGMRSGDKDAIALLLAESKLFDAERDAKEARKQEKIRKDSKKRKSDAVVDGSRKGPRLDETIADAGAARKLMLEERRVVYNTFAVEMPKKRKSSSSQATTAVSVIPDPPLDDMINAASRGFNCYRLPAQLYFENDKTESDHQQCKPEAPEGCTRCRVQPSAICCELCSPAYFASVLPPVTADSSTEAPKTRAGNKKEYTYSPQDFALRNALHDWRKTKTSTELGDSWLRDFGASYIMSDDVLTAVVDHAHHDRLHSPADLLQHTKWSRATEFGDEIIQKVHLIHPRPPSVSAVPPDVSATSSRKINLCGKCRQPGHNGAYFSRF